MSDDRNKAIEAALSQNWPKAQELNLAILKGTPRDIEALNRLAMAYLQQGKTAEAKKIYRHVLKSDPVNSIAQKNLKKISRGFYPKANNGAAFNQTAVFLEEPGKSKLINLVNVASQRVLTTCSICEPVNLVIKRHGISVTKDGVYLGALPDDLAFRLIRLINLGNKYAGFIKSVERNSLQVFVHEVKRAKRLGNQPSFPTEGGASYSPAISSKKILNLDETPPEGLIEEEDSSRSKEGSEESQGS